MTKRMNTADPHGPLDTVPSGLVVDGRSPAPVGCQADRWLIVGAGGFGREMYSWTFGRLGSTTGAANVGFLDDNMQALDSFPRLKGCWSGRISDYMPRPGDRLLMAIGDPSTKLTVWKNSTISWRTFRLVHSSLCDHRTRCSDRCRQRDLSLRRCVL